MKPRLLPSAGIIWLCLVLISTCAFFGWGLRTPRFDKVRQLEVALALGQRGPLDAKEFQLFQQMLRDYPAYAEHLTDGAAAAVLGADGKGAVDLGYAYVIRTRAVPGEVLRLGLLEKRKQLDIQARWANASSSGRAERDAPWLWQLPAAGPFPQLVELRLSDKVPVEINYSAAGDARRAPRPSDMADEDEREEP